MATRKEKIEVGLLGVGKEQRKVGQVWLLWKRKEGKVDFLSFLKKERVSRVSKGGVSWSLCVYFLWVFKGCETICF